MPPKRHNIAILSADSRKSSGAWSAAGSSLKTVSLDVLLRTVRLEFALTRITQQREPMNNSDRRKFLQTMGAAAMAGALPGSITKALATPAHNRTGTIADVEHIVIITQENQSFD